ncbi:MAG: flavodoxin-dependent (E)-4-hydroxy-3-methylbut-2-enyl-diphosphate synthase [Coriobacteriia bacterium]|nr:flavodoxin-dependent (E)-4-hydroxy-3-methylbut-2-enyl-diphosphate synthase [Coriobacteriia bacterium]
MVQSRITRQVSVGGVRIGGTDLPVIQSMTNTDTKDHQATLEQIERLKDAGCEIIRVAVPCIESLKAFGIICENSPLPVVADVHFDYRLAIEATKLGAAKLRINPGNIGSLDRVEAVIVAAKEASIPIRIGVNAGSLAKNCQDPSVPLATRLVSSALEFCSFFEAHEFFDIVISAKASSVRTTIDAYRSLAQKTDYPLHIGVTESGTEFGGSIKSAVGLGTLLEAGIGDTLRVSLTADPVKEVEAAWEILAALDIKRNHPELISCPTCGRCQVDMIPLAQEVERRLKNEAPNLKIAVMGCVVNGPGEAREADFGIACGKSDGIIFSHGEPLRKVAEDRLVDALFEEIRARAH